MPITNVADALREVGRSPHIQSREQAIAVGLKAQRARRRSGRRTERQSRAAEARRSGRR